jgi:hypothetical protein
LDFFILPVDSVSIPLEPAVDNLILTRKQPELTDDLVAALVGVYDLPMEVMSITITAHDGKIYGAMTGDPTRPL